MKFYPESVWIPKSDIKKLIELKNFKRLTVFSVKLFLHLSSIK